MFRLSTLGPLLSESYHQTCLFLTFWRGGGLQNMWQGGKRRKEDWGLRTEDWGLDKVLSYLSSYAIYHRLLSTNHRPLPHHPSFNNCVSVWTCKLYPLHHILITYLLYCAILIYCYLISLYDVNTRSWRHLITSLMHLDSSCPRSQDFCEVIGSCGQV